MKQLFRIAKQSIFTGVMCLINAAASAQTSATATATAPPYPAKPVRVVTGGVGGSSDISVRIIAPGLSSSLGQQVIVDNRSSSLIPGEIVARADPDGYTLLFAGGVFAIAPLLQKSPYDPVREFAPITIVTNSPHIVVVNPAVAAQSVKELIALARSKPGTLNYAGVGIGASSHLAAELFKSMAGVDIVHVNYKSGGAAINDLIGGQIQLQFGTSSSVMAHVKSGKLRALAHTGAQPSALVPGLATVAASGLPGYESGTIFSMYAPAAVPERLIMLLSREIARVLSTSNIREQFLSLGAEPVGSTPAQLAAAMKSEITKLGKVIKDAGIRAD